MKEKENNSLNCQYLTVEDINLIKDLIKNHIKNYVSMLKYKTTNKKCPGFQNRLQQEFSTLIGCDENTNITTKLYMILNGLREKPKCPICGKYLKNVKGIKYGFYKTCGNPKCAQLTPESITKRKATCRDRFGFDTPAENPEVKKKSEETSMRNHGVKNGGASKQAIEKQKQTCLKKFGHKSYWGSQKYREDLPNILKKREETCMKKFGTTNGGASKQAWEKIHKTMKENGTSSKFEEKYYLILIDRFGEDDIIRQYKSEKYPFYCDFYIKSLDLYIEIQGDPGHGKHTFDPNSPEDIKLVEKWKEKAKNNPKGRYNKFIFGWTERDVKKRKIAKENNINFLEIWEKSQNFYGNVSIISIIIELFKNI